MIQRKTVIRKSNPPMTKSKNTNLIDSMMKNLFLTSYFRVISQETQLVKNTSYHFKKDKSR